MSSYLDFDGVYDKNKRYVFHNWSKEDFNFHFGEDSGYNDNKIVVITPAHDITVKADEMRELNQFQAFTMCKAFVDREMVRDSNKIKDPKERERKEMGVLNKDLRKPFEDKTISEIKAGDENPIMNKLREEIRAEEKAKLANKKPVAVKGEFDGVK